MKLTPPSRNADVLKNGKPVARVVPATPAMKTGKQIAAEITAAPHPRLGVGEAGAFAADLRKARAELPPLVSPWD